MASTSATDQPPAPAPSTAAAVQPERPEAPPSKKMLLAIVTNDRVDASLGFAVAMLKFQVAICTTDMLVDMHHFRTTEDALNAFATSDHGHAFVVDGTVTFDAELPLRAATSPHDLVVGMHPLSGYDWAGLKAAADANGGVVEDPRLLATTHNVDLADENVEYAPVSRLRKLAAFYVSRAAIRKLAAAAPRHATGWLFFAPGIFDGVYETPERRFLRMYNAPIVADTARLCGFFGPTEFAGCIAHRTHLR